MRQRNMVIMLTSVMMSMVLAVGTILQFHHHDEDGHIFLTLLPSLEVTLGGELHHGTLDHCQHDEDSSEGREMCSMHFDPTIEPDHSNHDFTFIEVCLEVFDGVASATEFCASLSFYDGTLVCLPESHVLSFSLRAPPVIG